MIFVPTNFVASQPSHGVILNFEPHGFGEDDLEDTAACQDEDATRHAPFSHDRIDHHTGIDK